jgi:hypothetical protein
MKGCIAGSQYIPSIEYFTHWLHYETLLLEKEEHYQKRSWRNKTLIQGKEEPLALTVPLRKGKNNQHKISAVEIAYDTPWEKAHLHSLKTAYGKTAFFDEVFPGLDYILRSGYAYLWDLNVALLNYITSFLPGTWKLQCTTTYLHTYDSSVADLRPGIPCGLTKGNEESFPEYPQVHRLQQTHQPNLCILDLLCHLGPGAVEYLAQVEAKLYKKP